jgi:hypothetical protein
VWNAIIQSTVPPWQCTSAYEYRWSHSNNVGAFQLGVVWPPFIQP